MKLTDLATEENDQKALVDYMTQLRIVRFAHIPNSTFTKSWSVRLRNKLMGVSPGFPDLAIIIKNKFFFIEMKRAKGSVISDFQKDWIQAISDTGVPVYVCYGFDEARRVIDRYINEKL